MTACPPEHVTTCPPEHVTTRARGLIDELGLQGNASLFDFTKEPFYVFERCNVIALPSTGKEGLPNVLLEALAMEKPCVATRSYGMPEVGEHVT